ncbi:hypothetical protein [Fulvivirga sedimenti]|uniref:EamA domain-containing protein n=1 Tax=Fulvivirga sedimenti TaxID=2879465 RepID=A0A9X1HL77_9BACT|nr:hypothetical protein [Fulvivirga sedimenti]MCA6074040.1 hypothetical protein [Fulvivirga sedimenti]
MLAILLCIIANVGIFLSFRLFQYYRVNTFHAIVVNYITCVVTGVLFTGWPNVVDVVRGDTDWIPWAVVLGGIFIATFYLMARTTQVFSMTVASISTKMSLIIPVLFSLLILGTRSRDYNLLNYLGMAAAVVAIVLSSVRKKSQDNLPSNVGALWYLPLLVFLLGGLIDTTLNAVNQYYLSEPEEKVFPIFIFGTAGIIGFVIVLIRGSAFSRHSITGGIFLGIVNYFSVYFLLMSLRVFKNDGAYVYPMINVGIILISALISALFFGEKFTYLKMAGLLLAIAAILLLSHQELIAFF